MVEFRYRSDVAQSNLYASLLWKPSWVFVLDHSPVRHSPSLPDHLSSVCSACDPQSFHPPSSQHSPCHARVSPHDHLTTNSFPALALVHHTGYSARPVSWSSSASISCNTAGPTRLICSGTRRRSMARNWNANATEACCHRVSCAVRAKFYAQFTRLLLRFERLQPRHSGMTWLASTLMHWRAFCGVYNSPPVLSEHCRAVLTRHKNR
jgi:hypothetical protein